MASFTFVSVTYIFSVSSHACICGNIINELFLTLTKPKPKLDYEHSVMALK